MSGTFFQCHPNAFNKKYNLLVSVHRSQSHLAVEPLSPADSCHCSLWNVYIVYFQTANAHAPFAYSQRMTLPFISLRLKQPEENFSSPVTKFPSYPSHYPYCMSFLSVVMCRGSSPSKTFSFYLGPTSSWLLKNLTLASSSFLSLLGHSLQHTSSLKIFPLTTQPCSTILFLCFQLLKFLQKSCLCSVSIPSCSLLKIIYSWYTLLY